MGLLNTVWNDRNFRRTTAETFGRMLFSCWPSKRFWVIASNNQWLCGSVLGKRRYISYIFLWLGYICCSWSRGHSNATRESEIHTRTSLDTYNMPEKSTFSCRLQISSDIWRRFTRGAVNGRIFVGAWKLTQSSSSPSSGFIDCMSNTVASHRLDDCYLGIHRRSQAQSTRVQAK